MLMRRQLTREEATRIRDLTNELARLKAQMSAMEKSGADVYNEYVKYLATKGVKVDATGHYNIFAGLFWLNLEMDSIDSSQGKLVTYHEIVDPFTNEPTGRNTVFAIEFDSIGNREFDEHCEYFHYGKVLDFAVRIKPFTLPRPELAPLVKS
jgi:hypothetical protein